MRLNLIAVASFLSLASIPILADPIPYTDIGRPAQDESFTSTVNGIVTAYFYSPYAGSHDKIIFWGKTSVRRTASSFDNHNFAVGSSVSLSSKHGGALLFVLDDVKTSQYLSSVDYFDVDSTANENLGVIGPKPLADSGLDFDSNDDFVATDVSETPASTPEPSTIILFGTGLVGVASALRRKFARG